MVSLIVPAYNEENHIRACLNSLLCQTVSGEIIVVDDGSTDRTSEIVQSFPAVQLLQQNHQGPGKARNLGAQHAIGDILVFCDADQEFHPQYVEKLTAPILAGNAIGTYSREEFIANYDNVWARCYNIDAEIYTDSRHHSGHTDDASPVFRAILRSIFVSIGGYDDTGYGEDHSVGRKTGVSAIPAPGAICFHHNPDNLSEVYGQARWYGKGNLVKKDWRTMLWCTPPVAAIGSIKRAVISRTPAFVLYSIVYRLGVLSGIVSWHLSRGKHVR
jgi:glycosyltransferase involved in cell wall biosynthesis